MEYIVAIAVAIFGSTGFWTWINNRHASNKDILAAVRGVEGRVAAVEGQVSSVQDDLDSLRAEEARVRVLRFNAELLRGERHTEEEFVQVLSDIDKYTHFCRTRPDFPNSQAEMAIKNCKRAYEHCLRERDFL